MENAGKIMVVRRSGSLTEDEVKQAFVPFLKEFYRYRYEYRPDSVVTEFDNLSEEGFVADGVMRFRKADGTMFTCTYEATSRDKLGEVKFTLNTPYFIWDCLGFGALLAAFFYATLYITRFGWLVSLRWNGNFGLLLGIGMIGFFAWYFLMQGWRKYRYIYAIEQFKHYGADEQWVALADDVFPAPTDPYLLELKEQCVYNGFGLAIVSAEKGVRPLVAPSRLEMYGKDRHIAHWVTRTEWFQAMAQNVGILHRNRPQTIHTAWNRVWRPIDHYVFAPARRRAMFWLSKPLGGDPAAIFDRFKEAHSVQKWVLILSLALIVPLAWSVLRFHAIEEADLKALHQWKPDKNNPEEDGYTLGQEDEPRPYSSNQVSGGIPKQYPIPRGKEEEDEGNTIVMSSDDEETEEAGPPKTAYVPDIIDKAKSPTLREAQPKKKQVNAVAEANCGGLAGKSGWLIVDGFFVTRGEAEARLSTLRQSKIAAVAAPRACLEGNEAGYFIWLGNAQVTEAVARIKAGELERALDRAGIKSGALVVLPL